MAVEAHIDVRQVAEFFRQRAVARQARLDTRFEHAWQDCRSIIQLILQKYHPVRVYQWGSLLDRQKFSEISDIDLAVEGLASPEQFFALYRDAEALTDFPLDLVEWEHIDPLHQASIRRKGRLVYERSDCHS
jgi:predicted nucleotidyltransferase